VKQVQWTQERRDWWKSNYEDARSSEGKYLTESLAGELTAGNLVDVVPAMAKPVVATSPYTSLEELTGDLGISRRPQPTNLPKGTVSAIVGRELLLPLNSRRSELELLREAVDEVTQNDDYRDARGALHDRLLRFTRDEVTDVESVQRAVEDIREKSNKLKDSIRNRKIWVNVGRLFSFAQIVLGAATAPIPPVAIGLVVAGVGQFTATEKLADPQQPKRSVPDLAMLLDVRRRLHL
jgi:hypothetical protein